MTIQPRLQVAVGVVKNAQGDILISLRDQTLHQGGLWEFPGGKVEAQETVEQALRRELNEELGITVISETPLITIQHQYPDLAVELKVFLVEDYTGDAVSGLGQPCRWVKPADLNHYAFPAANQPIITAAQLPFYYAILDDAEAAVLMVNLQKLLAGGLKLIQLRLKTVPKPVLKQFIEQAKILCKQAGALLLINSAVDHAKEFAVNGIHLTSRDLMSATQRPSVEHEPSDSKYWVSASCHNLQELLHAQAIGVDFAVLAPVSFTQTHPDTEPLGWKQFLELVSQVNLPVYALGGLSKEDLEKARNAGGQGIAAIRSFLQ